MIELLSGFLDLCTYAPLPGAVLGLLYFRRLSPEMRVITLLCIASLSFSIITTYLSNRGVNNLFLIHIDTMVEGVILLLFYRLLLKDWLTSRFFISAAIVFVSTSVGIALTMQPFNRFNTYSRSLEAVGVIALALLFFYYILKEMKIMRLENAPAFWVNTGLLLYFSGGSLLFSLSNIMLNLSNTQNSYLWGVHGMFYLVLYLLISVAFWKEIQRLMA